MRTLKSCLLAATAVAALLVPAAASAAFQHVISPGESLSSVAAADGLTVDELAAANGLSTASQLVAGTLLTIPPQSGASAGTAEATPAIAPVAVEPAVASAAGGYVVQPGDTLSGIAARSGLTIGQLAAQNGLDPSGLLVSGTHISVPGAAAPATTYVSAAPSSASPASATGGAQPTAEYVSPSTVGSIAAANGVPASLAEAIGYQESGFNNNEVSPSGATGVMQIEPGTWNYIGTNLAGPPPLSSSSASDNIRGGVLLLHSLLSQTGGDPSLAAAAYYQGLQSVRQNGMYADTQAYVNNVTALEHRFGG